MTALSVVVVTAPTASAVEYNFYICHATGQATSIESVGNWVVNRPNNSGQLSGHVGTGDGSSDHQNSLDIIPPIPGVLPSGQNWTTSGQEIYYNLNKQGSGCNVPDNDSSASVDLVSAPTCSSPSVVEFTMSNATATPTAPETTPGGPYSVTFTSTSGHRFSDGTKTKTLTYSIADRLPADSDGCATGTSTAAVELVSAATCTSPSVVEFAMTNASANPSAPATTPGNHSVTFTADSGYRFVDGANRVRSITVGYSIADRLPADSDGCAQLNSTATVELVTGATCTSPSVVRFVMTNASANPSAPATTPGNHSVTFTAASGYRFVEGANRVRSITVDYSISDRLPADSDGCAQLNATASVDQLREATCTNPSVVEFAMTNASATPAVPETTPGDYSVTFTADSGYRFVDGANRVKTITLNYTIDEPRDPDSNACATGNSTATVDLVSAATCTSPSVVRFAMTNATANPTTPATEPGDYSVTFTADSGYRLVDDNLARVRTMTVPYTIDGPIDVDDDRCAKRDATASVDQKSSEDCLSPSVVEFTMTGATANPTDPATTPGDHSVTFTADPGYRFVVGQDRVRTITIDYTIVDRLDPDSAGCAGKDAAAQVSTTPPACGVGERLVLGNTLHATWGLPTLWEGPGVYSVTATADPNYRFGDGLRTRTFTGSLAGPLADNNGPNFPGCDRPQQPEPTKRQVSGSDAGCDLQGVGGVATWTDEWTTTYVWNDTTGWTGVETGPVRVADDFVPYDDQEYFAECAPAQPADLVREVAGVQTDCDMNGTTYSVQTYTTAYVWNPETRAWELGEETGPVVTEEFIPFGGEVPEECIEEPEVKGDQAEVILHQLPEVKGEQAVAPGVPTAVDAGIGTEESPLGSRRNPLWLLAVGGGIGLMGSAGLRRRATARR